METATKVLSTILAPFVAIYQIISAIVNGFVESLLVAVNG
jgi:hypothetical protein